MRYLSMNIKSVTNTVIVIQKLFLISKYFPLTELTRITLTGFLKQWMKYLFSEEIPNIKKYILFKKINKYNFVIEFSSNLHKYKYGTWLKQKWTKLTLWVRKDCSISKYWVSLTQYSLFLIGF